ncbi:MAG TPA: glucosamine-6-phosphate isomerase [Candidatus Marinimicrobia bacterium]|nr:glucosamine-6-phosphate isomerase [Candidatus Neomarinimicrobiota bacterium]
MISHFSQVENCFFESSNLAEPTTPVPHIVVKNVPDLGLLTALRFLEWTADNPQGVISLPTGKTPEYFIKWTQQILANWNDTKIEKLRREHGLSISDKPDLHQLRFVQIDEFYPIDPQQHNSMFNYVQKFYVNGFGLDPKNCLLINCAEIPRPSRYLQQDIFPNFIIDLSLRLREPKSDIEKRQKKTIFAVDQWCSEYENRIQELGGIGFFLGGIGPDGHIAFNVRGSDHNSTTRILETNFETQAASAADLGGIEISRNRLALTIGLSTITSNPDVTAIIFAAGEAKAGIVKDSLESNPDINYPATVLQRVSGSRFYLTKGAAVLLDDMQISPAAWTPVHTERAVVQLCKKLNKFGHHLTLDDLTNDPVTAAIPNLNGTTLDTVLDSLKGKIQKLASLPNNKAILHTGPHHDDILLGYSPLVTHLVRSAENKNYFAVMTSGFTSVTNSYISSILKKTLELLQVGKIQMTDYPDFFEKGFQLKKGKDVYHYLDKVSAQNFDGQIRGLCHRIVRSLVSIYKLKSKKELAEKIGQILEYLSGCYDGENNPPDIQRLKGMLREFEEELAWAHYGVRMEDIHHLRLGFYTGDIFNEIPERGRDVEPILNLIKQTNPDIITLALDPEGSGPDTHYKVLQAIAEAIRIWEKEKDLSNVRIWGYRNVWYRFDPAEANLMFPVSLNSMAVLRDTFMTCYLSQKEASFPSYELDGPFCDLTQKIWVEQHATMELALGKDFWYQNEHPHLRATHGLVFLKEMTVDDFLSQARSLEESVEGIQG